MTKDNKIKLLYGANMRRMWKYSSLFICENKITKKESDWIVWLRFKRAITLTGTNTKIRLSNSNNIVYNAKYYDKEISSRFYVWLDTYSGCST